MTTFVLLIYSAAVFWSQPAYFQNVFPAEQAAEIVRIAHQNFWGKAVLSDGTFARPADESERSALPIPRNEAMRIVQQSAAAGLGAWCGVDWQSYYLAFMGSERTGRTSRWRSSGRCSVTRRAACSSPCPGRPARAVTGNP
jgi:hypothetical protein